MHDISANTSNTLYLSDKLSKFAQEVHNCFALQEYDMISDVDAGKIALRDLMFSRNVSAKALEQKVNDEISTKCNMARYCEYKVEVQFVRATPRDMVVIDVICAADNKTIPQQFIYK